MLKAYKYRLLPTDEQKTILANWFGACRFVYNLALETKIAAWNHQRKSVSSYALMKQLTELKNTEATWLKECPGQALETAITNLDSAYKKFFRGEGFPKFKKKSGRQSIQFRRDSSTLGNKIRLTKIGFIDFVQHRPLGDGEIRTVTVSKETTEKYFISILVKCDKDLPEKKPISPESAVGIDLGLKTFAVLSDGTNIENPKYLHKQSKRLRIEQRTFARRYKKGVKTEFQSKGWHKQKLVVIKLHEKIRNQRQDFLQKTSASIIKKYNTVCLEDLNVKGMAKNKSLAKAISDVSWAEFNRLLSYKAEWNGKNIIKIGRFEPSSKTCSACGSIKGKLLLSEREWTCLDCGTIHDRDENAAENIKQMGLVQSLQPLT